MQIQTKKKTLIYSMIIFFTVILITPIAFLTMTRGNANTSLIMGKAEMYVQNLEKMKYFYVDLVGLEILNEEDELLELGFKDESIITLVEKEGFSFENPNEAGLYHNAIVFNTRSDLAKSINTLLRTAPEYYQGSADHLVSEAFYFGDPEGNGVELYFDKPRSVWEYDENGKPKMGGIYIDEEQYIVNNMNTSSSPVEIKMGHIHLKVGDIQTAKEFYVDILGFDIIMQREDALFISRDGYHHHIGLNTWQSLGAGMRREDLYGLYRFELKITDSGYFSEIKKNITDNNKYFEEVSDREFITRDPWGNLVRVNGN